MTLKLLPAFLSGYLVAWSLRYDFMKINIYLIQPRRRVLKRGLPPFPTLNVDFKSLWNVNVFLELFKVEFFHFGFIAVSKIFCAESCINFYSKVPLKLAHKEQND